MSVPSEFTDSASQAPNKPGYAIDPGCAESVTLLGAATAVSVGISTVLQQMSGLRDRMTPIERPSQEFRSPPREMKKNSSLGQRKGATIDDEKKEDAIANVKNTPSDEMNGFKREPSYSEITPQGILYNATAAVKASSPARPRSNKVVRITPPRNSSSVGGECITASRSPVARMRSHSFDSTNLDRKKSSPSRPPPKSPEEVKAEKQRKWRSKMKLAQEQQRLEKQALTSGPRSRRRRASSRGSRGLAAAIGDHVLDMIVTHCGDADDAAYVSESDDSRTDESSTSSDRSRKGKSRKAKQNNRRSRSDHNRGVASVRAKSNDDLNLGHKGSGSYKDLPVKGPTYHVSQRSAKIGQSHIQVSQASSFEIAELPALRKNQSQDPVSDVSNVSSMASVELNMNETNYVTAFVHDMIAVGYQFFWQKEMMEMTPKSVVLRLKPGWKKPEGTFCGPRITWHLDEFEAYGINLFDIMTLDHATPAQLKEYPFAVPSRTVHVSMNRGQEFVFEAPSKDAALRFVYGMKLLVARLSFSLVTGNMDDIVELLDLKPPGNMVKRRTQPHTSLPVAAIDDLSQELLHRTFIL